MKHNMVSRSNMHEVLPQGPTRSRDGCAAAPRRARAAVSALTLVQAHWKEDEPTRPIRLSSQTQARERQQPTPPPTDTVWQELHAAPTPPRGTEGATILL